MFVPSIHFDRRNAIDDHRPAFFDLTIFRILAEFAITDYARRETVTRETEILLGIDRTETLPGLLTKARLPRFPCRSLDKRYGTYARRGRRRRTCACDTHRLASRRPRESALRNDYSNSFMMNERESGSIVAHHYINYPYNQVGYIRTIIASV